MHLRPMLVLTVLSCAVAAAALPEGWKATGKTEEVDGWSVARERTVLTTSLADNSMLRLGLRLGGLKQPASLRVTTGEGKSLDLTLSAQDDEYRVGIIGKEIIPLPDSCIQIVLTMPGTQLFNDRYYVRPHPHWYEKDDRKELLAAWRDWPPASSHELALKLETRGQRLRLWVDDRCVGGAPVTAPGPLTLTLSPGNAVQGGTTAPLAYSASYVAVGLHGYRRPGAMTLDEMPAAPGGDVPFELGTDEDRIDVGVSRWLSEAKGPEEYTDNYYTRSAFDNRPEDIVLAVPTDDYMTAHLLCTVDPDPATTPVLTLRLTRFLKDYYDSGGRGSGIADSSIRLEQHEGKWPHGCRQVGVVKVALPGGERTVPLLQVAVPLRSGQIQDVLDEQGLYIGRSTQCLDLELTRELHPIETANHGAYSIKPVGKPSGVHVYGLTLERAPVKVRLRSEHVGNVFYAADPPRVDLAMENQSGAPFAGKLSWRITNCYGESSTGEREVTVPLPDASKPFNVPIDLTQPRLGWFRASFLLAAADGHPVWEAPTSFAILPPDTRKAGAESPFGIWWFRKSHVGTDDIATMAPLLQRLGYRHVCPSRLRPGEGEELARFGLSLSMYPDFVRRGEKAVEMLDEMVKVDPGIGWALIFHESGFGEGIQFPPEFLGKEPPKLTPEQEKKFRELWDKAVAYSKAVRAKYPNIKLILGNGSLPFAVEFMRQGYPREYLDALGDEDLGQQIMPEAPPMAFKSVFWMREYAKRYKYDIPVTTCYEWRGRGTNPGNLSEVEQAQLYSRDVLQGLAYRMPNINPALLHDCGDAYYYSRWGSTGLCQRYPLLNPKLSYVALATLTRELDRAEFQRALPTGSPSLHALEFKQGARLVYALWLPRGEREVKLTFARDTSFTLTDMNGNAGTVTTVQGGASIPVSASVGYLATPVPLTGLSGGPTRCEAPPARTAIVDPLDSLSAWQPVSTPDPQLDKAHFDFPRQVGKVACEAVAEGRRQVLQLALQPQPEVPWPVARYVTLQPTASRAIPGRPNSVGVWVKGNSCWGRVFWEFEDARAEKFFSIGAPCGGWSVGDWRCRTFINFDGWNYLSEPLPFKYESGFYGPPQSEWTCTGGDGVVDYPIRFTRLVVELRDRVVHMTDPIEVPDNRVCLRDLSVGYPASEPLPTAQQIREGAKTLSITLDGEEGKQITTTASGLKYIVLAEGKGDKPKPGDSIVAEYTGWLLDGTKFDSSKDHGGGFEFKVGTGQVIKGWDEALLDMRVGERRKIILPPDLAYGAGGTPGGPIPPNAILVFEVSLLKIR